MSYSALTASSEQFVCRKCHKPIEDGEKVFVALGTEVNCLPEPGATDLNDGPWFSNLDFHDDFYYHEACFLELK